MWASTHGPSVTKHFIRDVITKHLENTCVKCASGLITERLHAEISGIGL